MNLVLFREWPFQTEKVAQYSPTALNEAKMVEAKAGGRNLAEFLWHSVPGAMMDGFFEVWNRLETEAKNRP